LENNAAEYGEAYEDYSGTLIEGPFMPLYVDRSIAAEQPKADDESLSSSSSLTADEILKEQGEKELRQKKEQWEKDLGKKKESNEDGGGGGGGDEEEVEEVAEEEEEEAPAAAADDGGRVGLTDTMVSLMQPFSVQEQARFAVEVVAQKKDRWLVGKALGRSTKDCVLYYYAHFKHGRKPQYRRLKGAMREVQPRTAMMRTRRRTRMRTSTGSAAAAAAGWTGGARGSGRGCRARRRSPSWRSGYRRRGAAAFSSASTTGSGTAAASATSSRTTATPAPPREAR
jgi:hypothetical protein